MLVPPAAPDKPIPELRLGPSPLVWLDVTTSWRARSGQSNGTLRVERSYALTLGELMKGRIRFCRYRPETGHFVEVPFASVQTAASARPTPKAKAEHAGFDLGRHLERAIRQWRRRTVSGLVRRIDAYTGRKFFPSERPGDVLLLAGETWGQHDFSLLKSLRHRHSIRIAALCQDLIPIKCPQFFADDTFVKRYSNYVDFLINEVDLLIAISESTRSDILDCARVRGGVRGHIEVVKLGADLPGGAGKAPPEEVRDLRSGQFVLSVSTIQSRKNFDLLYHLWRRLSEERLPNLPKLIIVGQSGFGSDDLLWQISRDPVVKDSISVLHRVSDDGLAWLYHNCLWTLYPSFYEGWGLPISESLAYGKYCLAASGSSLSEAGEGLIQHLDPLDFRAWRDAVIELIGSPDALSQREARIKERFRPTTWACSAGRLAGRLEDLLAQPVSTG